MLNGKALEGFKGWTVISPRNDIVVIENPPIGAFPCPVSTNCWATSYAWSTLNQHIHLSHPRYCFPSTFLGGDGSEDQIALVTLFACARFDQSVILRVSLQCFGSCIEDSHDDVDMLHDRLKKFQFQSSLKEFQFQSSRQWKRVELWSRIPRHTECIQLSWSGKDQRYWRGHYGVKVSGVSFRFISPHERRIVSSSVPTTTSNAVDHREFMSFNVTEIQHEPQ